MLSTTVPSQLSLASHMHSFCRRSSRSKRSLSSPSRRLCRSELELELILSRWMWERGEKGGASLQKQARVRALCGVMQ